MNTKAEGVQRRHVLFAPFAAGLACLGGAAARAATSQKATLIAKFVERVPASPDDDAWKKSDVLEVPLAPQAVVKPRIYETATRALQVRGFYDDTRVAFLLEWKDPQRDASIGMSSAFRDAVALEFPATPAAGIPYFAMGEPGKAVTIYQWKADWELSRHDDVDDTFPNMAVDWYPLSGHGPGELTAVGDYGKEGAEKAFHTSWWAGNPLGNPELQARTSVEKLRAEGFGSLTSLEPGQQDALGKADWRDGAWRIVVSIPRDQEAFRFESGLTLPIAFAAWNGAGGERGGEKAVSTWYFLSLEKPLSKLAFIAPVLAFLGAAAAQTWAMRGAQHSETPAPDDRV